MMYKCINECIRLDTCSELTRQVYYKFPKEYLVLDTPDIGIRTAGAPEAPSNYIHIIPTFNMMYHTSILIFLYVIF